MTKQLKEDIKTIIEVASFIFSVLIFGVFYEIFFGKSSVSSLLIIVGWGVLAIYKKIFLRHSKDVVLFSALNDQSSRMVLISLGILMLFLTGISLLVFNGSIYGVIAGLGISFFLFLLAIFQSPVGFIKIEGNFLKMYGLKEKVDVRQLKMITLSNNGITLIDINNENKKSIQPKLNQQESHSIKKYLSEKLRNYEIVIADNVV